MKTMEELDEELCDYCPLEDHLKGSCGTPSGYYSCEGSHCEEAYEACLSENSEQGCQFYSNGDCTDFSLPCIHRTRNGRCVID